MNTSQPFARNCAFLLMCFLCFTHLLMSLNFLSNTTYFAPVLPLSLLFSALLGFFYARRTGMQRRLWYKVLGMSILVVIAALLFACFYFDFSWDGQWYHQAAIYNLAEGWNPVHHPIQVFDKHNDLSIIHFPKVSWYFAAASMALFGEVEMGKSINLIALFAAALMVYQAARDFNFGKRKAFAISILSVLNPVVWCEITTYLVDGLLYTFMLIYLSALFSAIHRPDKQTLLIGAMAVFGLVNTKFTGLVFYCFFAFCGFVYVIARKRNYWKEYIIMNGIAFLAAVLLFGFNPYVTNYMERGHPFYPIMGTEQYPSVYEQSGQDDNELYETPVNMMGKNRIVRLFYSHFSRPGNAPYNKEKKAELMWPFMSKPLHWKNYYFQDVRLAGFGPWFSGLLLISLVLYVHCFKAMKSARWMIAVSFAAILLSLLFNIHFWWVRLVPQLWLFPLIPLALLCFQSNQKRWMTTTLATLILLNAMIVLCFHMYWETSTTLMARRQFREIKQKNKPILIRYGRFNRAIEEKLKKRDIQFIPATNQEVRSAVHYNLASVVEGYPNMVQFREKE